MNLNKLFIKHCKNKDLEINKDQVNIIELMNNFYQLNFNTSFLPNFIFKLDELETL